MCNNLRELAEKDIIEKKITAGELNTRLDGDNTWFTLDTVDSASCSTTTSLSAKLKVGIGKISNISNETKASITKSYGSSFSKQDGCAFYYSHSGDKIDIKENQLVQPVIYWIPVSALRAKYKTRTDNVDLRFIPDYIWKTQWITGLLLIK